MDLMNAGDPAFGFTEREQVDRDRGRFRCGRLALGGQGCRGRFHPGDGLLLVVQEFVLDRFGQPFQGGQLLVVLGNAHVADDVLPGPAGPGSRTDSTICTDWRGELGVDLTRTNMGEEAEWFRSGPLYRARAAIARE